VVGMCTSNLIVGVSYRLINVYTINSTQSWRFAVAIVFAYKVVIYVCDC